MTYEIIGLVFYLVFLGAGVIVYAYSRGLWYPPNPDIRKSAEEFRQKNAGWLRLGAIAVIAIMALNTYLSLKALFGF